MASRRAHIATCAAAIKRLLPSTTSAVAVPIQQLTEKDLMTKGEAAVQYLLRERTEINDADAVFARFI